jgi:hypothetical protein
MVRTEALHVLGLEGRLEFASMHSIQQRVRIFYTIRTPYLGAWRKDPL